MLCIKREYISKSDLEKIIKTQGNEIVVGYCRFKRIKSIDGYKKAKEVISSHVSVITGAFRTDEGNYVLVVRFRLWPLWIILGLILAVFIVMKKPFKAEVREPVDYVNPELPTIIDDGETEYEGKLMSVPGYIKIEVSSNNKVLELRNPAINECILVYELFLEDRLIGRSNYIYPGNNASVNVSEIPESGTYEVKLLARGFSMDKKTEYNSVSQKIEIKII